MKDENGSKAVRAVQDVLRLIPPERFKNPTEKWILTVIASYANADGTNSFPSVQTISDQSLVPRRTVERAISRMAEEGILKRESRAVPVAGTKTHKNRYRIPFDEILQGINPPNSGGLNKPINTPNNGALMPDQSAKIDGPGPINTPKSGYQYAKIGVSIRQSLADNRSLTVEETEEKRKTGASSAARLLGAGSFSSPPKSPAGSVQEKVPDEGASGKRTDAELAEGFQAWVDEGHPEKTFHEYRPAEHELEWAAFKKRRLALARKYLTWVVDRFSGLRLQNHLRPQLMALFLRVQATDAELSTSGATYSLIQFATQQELTLVDEYNDFTAASLLGTLGERLASIRTEFKRQQANKALGDRLTAEARAKVVRETEERRDAEEAESLEDDDDPFADIDSRHAVTV